MFPLPVAETSVMLIGKEVANAGGVDESVEKLT
jgi:hypothetical protein